MSCFLCNSYFHVTHFCDKYITNESRKNIVLPKINKFFTTFAWKKCYICYSRSHNTLYCLDRFTAPNFFIPNIDQDLLRRFLAMLDVDEKQYLAFQSPTISNLCPLETQTIVDKIKFDKFMAASPIHSSIIRCKNLELFEDFVKYRSYQMFCERIVAKRCTLFVENIKLSNISISSQILSMLLSSKTKTFTISQIEFKTKITLDEIFQYAPNLEDFDFEFNTWRDHQWQDKNFFKWKYGKKFKYLKITVNKDFDVTTLFHFMNKIPSNIDIDVYVSMYSYSGNDRQMFLEKISKYYVSAESSNNQPFSLYLQQRGYWNEGYIFEGSFALKN